MANKFWLGGTGNWDGTTGSSAHWGTATGGGTTPTAGPGVNDVAIFDGLSGGGTVTVTGNITVQSITCGAFTGTLDFNANNNNVTLSAAGGFNGSGSGTRTINLGNGIWTLSTTTGGNVWNMTTTTGLTFNANSSNISLTGIPTAGNTMTFVGGGLTYNSVTFGTINGGVRSITGANSFTTLTLTGQNFTIVGANQTITTLNVNGTSSGQVGLISSSIGTQRTLTVTTLSATYGAFRDLAFSGSGLVASNSFDIGNNSGATITAPVARGLFAQPGMTGGMD